MADLQFPREPARGASLDASWGAQVVQCLRALALSPGVGYLLKRTRGGTTLEILAKGEGATAEKTPRALFTEDASTQAEGAQVTVSPGRIANLPPKIGGVELGDTPAPKLAIGQSGVVYLRGTFDADGAPTAFSIEAGAEVPPDTETLGHKVLAEVDLDEGQISRLDPVTWNLSEVQKCGPTTYLWGGFGG